MGRPRNKVLRKKIIEYRQKGMGTREIARLLSKDPSQIHKVIKQIESEAACG